MTAPERQGQSHGVAGREIACVSVGSPSLAGDDGGSKGESEMNERVGWIQCSGQRVLVEQLREQDRYYVVRLCSPCGRFERGRELSVPKAFFVSSNRARENRRDVSHWG